MKKAKESESVTSPKLGVIDANSIYSLELFKKLSGLGDTAMRSARHSGLRVTRIGRRGFVKGSDFLAYLDKLKESSAMSTLGV